MLHLPSGDKMCFDLSPNKHMQRAGRHKVLGRGRSSLLLSQVPLARLPTAAAPPLQSPTDSHARRSPLCLFESLFFAKWAITLFDQLQADYFGFEC